MKSDVLRVRSLHVLQRLLAPLVALRVHRAHQRKAAAKQQIHLPDPEVLKAQPLFSRWPTAALQSWTASGVVEAHAQGTAIAFAAEPRRAADVFWLLSGKLSQVPNKVELRRCAGELVHLPHNVPKSGPLILPSHFMEGNAKKSLPPPTPAQEHLADSLAFYHAGQLVDLERLLLGGERLRALRCQSDVVVVRLSLAACLHVMQMLPSVARVATIDAARLHMQRAMVHLSGAPSTPAIMAANPVLAALSPAVLKTIRLQLKPRIFLKGEVICDNVFAAEWVFFVSSGQVSIEDSNAVDSRVLSTPCATIGVDAAVQCHMPQYFDQKSRATAATYCEMWGLSVSTFLSVCDAASRLRCALAAAQLLRVRGTGRLPVVTALRSCACFANLSESAVVAVAQVLHLRVYTPGEVVIPAGRIPRFGLLVVSGDVRLHRSAECGTRQLPSGQAHYFCEALVKMGVVDAVISRSSSVVLQGTPSLLLEAMETPGLTSDEVPLLLRDAQAYVDRVYGAGSSEISKAQYAAAERVRAYKRRQVTAVAKGEQAHVSAAALASPAASSAEVLQNELLTCLEVQLQALHPGDDDVARFEYFRAGTQATAVGGSDYQPAPLTPPQPPRRSQYFSLDEQGNLITCDEPTGSTDTVIKEPPPPPPKPKLSDLTPTGTQKVLSPTPPPPAVAKVKRSSAPTRNAPAAALRTPVRPPPPRKKSLPKDLSPRIASLRVAAARLKDEADGVDQLRKHHRQLAHHTPR
jgi:CRP-like cAMP-binding protein